MNRLLDFLFGVPLVWFLSRLRKDSPIVKATDVRKVLVIKLAAVGDTILLIPVLKAFRKSRPDIQIDWMVSSINDAVARTVPYVDRLLRWEGGSPVALVKLIRFLRGEKYDAIVDLEQWARGTALLSYFSGAPIRLGFNTPGQRRAGLYTHTYAKTFDDHELFDFHNLFGTYFNFSRETALELKETPEGKDQLSRALPPKLKKAPESRWVLFHPGCGADGTPREWPLSSYAVLGHWLTKNFHAQLFLTGGPEERKKTMALKKLLNDEAVDLGGQLTWPAIISLVKQMDLVVSGNTGIMHVAAALQRPQVALHGPTNPVLWGPLNSRARIVQSPCPQCPCLKLGFEYHDKSQSCMKKIEIDEVKRVVVDTLRS